ncbi:unnamed protein product, partial [Timema podura]|nr:unnamed protein product [Timema podura]
MRQTNQSTGSIDVDKLLSLNLRLLYHIGWPTDGSRFFGRLRTIRNSSIIGLAIIFTAMYNLTSERLAVKTVYLMFLQIESFTFLIVFYIKYDEFIDLVCYLKEVLLLPRKEIITRKLTYFWLCMCMTVIIGYNLTPLVEIYTQTRETNATLIDRPLPYRIWLPFSIDDSPTYELVFMYTAVALFATSMNYPPFDGLGVACLVHMSYQFKILQYSLRHLKANSVKAVEKRRQRRSVNGEDGEVEPHVWKAFLTILEEQDEDDQSKRSPPYEDNQQDVFVMADYSQSEINQEMWRNLVICIQHHNQILKFAEMVTAMYSPLILVVVLVDVAVLTLIAFELITTVTGSFKFWTVVHILMCAFAQPLFYCWISDLVATQSELVAVAAYESDWYDAPLYIKKTLKMVMLRANRPVSLSVSKFKPLTLTTFEGILKVAYSYYAVLRQVYVQEENIYFIRHALLPIQAVHTKTDLTGWRVRCADHMKPSIRLCWHYLRQQAAASRAVMARFQADVIEFSIS